MDRKAPGSFKFSLALCGLGRAGHIHFKGVRMSHRCRLKYIVEDVIDKADSVLTTYNMPEVTVVSGKEFDVVLSDPEVQAVIVATPTYTHEEFVTRALKAGKAVFCEKPIAEEIEQVALCYDEAQRAGKPLFCAFNRRFDTSMARIQAKVADGEIGKVHIIKTTSRDSPLPSIEYLKISGGMFHDTAVHDLDMICWILGEEPDTIHTMAHSHTQAISDLNDVDTFVITMKFSSGAISVTDASRHSTYGYDQRVEVFGSAGMVQCHNPTIDSVAIMKDQSAILSPAPYSFPQRYEQAYMSELDHFLDLLCDPMKTPKLTKRDTLRATQLAEACETSYKTGQVVSFKYKEF